MTTGHKTIVAMLAVVAVLLAVNIVQGPRAAEAQEVGDGDPYVVSFLPYASGHGVYRVWSDGQIDQWFVRDDNCEETFNRVFHGPADHESPVVFAAVDVSNTFTQVFADGRVDVLYNRAEPVRCTFEGTGGAACLGDVDRDGDNDFDDLLYVLSGWGSCE